MFHCRSAWTKPNFILLISMRMSFIQQFSMDKAHLFDTTDLHGWSPTLYWRSVWVESTALKCRSAQTKPNFTLQHGQSHLYNRSDWTKLYILFSDETVWPTWFQWTSPSTSCAQWHGRLLAHLHLLQFRYTTAPAGPWTPWTGGRWRPGGLTLSSGTQWIMQFGTQGAPSRTPI